MKLCIIFALVTFQGIIYCHGKPAVNNPNAQLTKVSSVKTATGGVTDIADGLVGLVEYAKPIIIYYAASLDKTLNGEDKDHLPVFEEIVKQSADNIVIGPIRSAEQSLNLLILCIFKLWYLKDTPKGKQLLRYLKKKYNLDLTKVFRILENDNSKSKSETNVDAGDLASDQDQSDEEFSKDVVEAGDYIFEKLKINVDHAEAVRQSINKICGGARDVIMLLGSQSITLTSRGYNVFLSALPENTRNQITSTLGTFGNTLYAGGAKVASTFSGITSTAMGWIKSSSKEKKKTVADNTAEKTDDKT